MNDGQLSSLCARRRHLRMRERNHVSALGRISIFASATGPVAAGTFSTTSTCSHSA